eukprot:TRINITY_DN20066_c0_g1_i2.p1 TRINITY_DN20066_c0_g1~~TRINITY_DN20066_c0_g1_i2.p1  ORF type:complete len:166 (-),score=30.84 TRINITY_DN20066_c0_g1_i2:54-494(-)
MCIRDRFGLLQSYDGGFLYRYVEMSLSPDTDKEIVMSQTANMFTFFGVGMVLSAVFIGKAIDRFGIRKIFYVAMLIFTVMLSLSYLQLYLRDYILACTIGILCGIAEVLCGTLIFTTITTEFKGNIDYFGLSQVVLVFGILSLIHI